MISRRPIHILKQRASLLTIDIVGAVIPTEGDQGSVLQPVTDLGLIDRSRADAERNDRSAWRDDLAESPPDTF
jgi:hypothetical protein